MTIVMTVWIAVHILKTSIQFADDPAIVRILLKCVLLLLPFKCGHFGLRPWSEVKRYYPSIAYKLQSVPCPVIVS